MKHDRTEADVCVKTLTLLEIRKNKIKMSTDIRYGIIVKIKALGNITFSFFFDKCVIGVLIYKFSNNGCLFDHEGYWLTEKEFFYRLVLVMGKITFISSPK